MKPRLAKLWKAWIRPCLLPILLVCVCRSAVSDVNVVPSGSMKPTILEGDRILVNKMAYDLRLPFTPWHLVTWGEPRRGEIVTFRGLEDGRLFVKRVVGLPGDRIALRDDRLYVNGKPAAYEPLPPEVSAQVAAPERSQHRFAVEYLGSSGHPMMTAQKGYAGSDFGPEVVPAGHLFVMGDHRNNSRDSRTFGFLPRDRITGRAFRVAWSLDPAASNAPRWRRFFSRLP